jgi:FKBP-type peptidyl-prolyl cis-trans isomerase
MKNTMKTSITMIIAGVIALGLVSCDAQYKKTSSGLVYKIIRGNSKDSIAKTNDVLKYHLVLKINDSLLYDTHGKMPQYGAVSERAKGSYSYYELLGFLRKGDSAIAIQLADTLFKKGYQAQIPFAKKGDHLKVYLKVLEVFRSDSSARIDAKAEYDKDTPRREKEEQEAMAKLRAKEEKEMQDYFAAKKITPTQKAPLGTYVLINEKGSGEPVVKGKFVTVKYDGRLMKNEQQFDAGVYTFQIQVGNAIMGWHDGLALFNQGGKGVLYVPASLGYGEQGSGPIPPNAGLKFDVELLSVNDTEAKAMVADSIARKQIMK